MQVGRFDEAERRLLSGLSTTEKALGLDNKRTITIFRSIVKLYDEWEKPRAAEPYRLRLEGRTDEATSVP